MEKLVNEIIALFGIDSRINRRLWTGYLGILLSVFFAGICYLGIMEVLGTAKQASDGYKVFMSILCSILNLLLVLWLIYYLIKYLALMLITLIRYGLSFTINISEDSIVSIMTTEVEDKRRMYKAIIQFLNEYSTPTHFAALYMWLNKKQLIVMTDQVKFLELLKADYPDKDKKSGSNSNQITVPSPSSFSEAKTKLEKEKGIAEGIFMLIESKMSPFIRENGE